MFFYPFPFIQDLAARVLSLEEEKESIDYWGNYLKMLPDRDHQDACRDLGELVASFSGDAYSTEYLCPRETFTAYCMPFLHKLKNSNRKFILDKNNNYKYQGKFLSAYIKEKKEVNDAHVTLASKAVQDFIKPCKLRIEGNRKKALDRVRKMPVMSGKDALVVDRYQFNPSQAEALQRYLNGTGMIYYLHITYTAGTTIIGLAKKNSLRLPPTVGSIWNPGEVPFPELQSRYLKSGFQMVSNEAPRGMQPVYIQSRLSRFDDMMVDGKILFVTTWRNPVVKLHYRYAAGEGPGGSGKGWGVHWWLTGHTNNYYLRKMVGKGNSVSILTRQDVELAKQRMRQFTVILIFEWLTHSVPLLCTVLQWERCDLEPHRKSASTAHTAHVNSTREGFGSDQAYTFVQERNRLDMELYEYAVELNLKQLRAFGLPMPPFQKYTN
jgi:hypothetical protein